MVHGTVSRRRQKKLDELLDAALELVAEEGLDGLTVSALAKRMEWTKGAMYRYFRGKHELVSALNRRVIDAWTEEVEAVVALEHSTHVDALRAIVAESDPAEVVAVANVQLFALED